MLADLLPHAIENDRLAYLAELVMETCRERKIMVPSPGGLERICGERESAFADRDPEVLVVGAGQGGLILGARLRQMGVDALVIEQGERVGDVWRHRYNNLTLHNKLTANHFPYMPFPETWPVWLPKDTCSATGSRPMPASWN